MTKNAFIAIVGRPNVGKSSILNRFIGQKIAIVSDKPQTTRTRLLGVYTKDEYQIIFIDTPGMHKPKTHLGKYMVRSINESMNGGDACMLVVDPLHKPGDVEKGFIERFKASGTPCILVINKVDTVKNKEELMPTIAAYNALYDFNAIVPVSALNGDGIQALEQELFSLCEEGDRFFDEETVTDQPERAIAAEMIREKILRLTNDEIPHGIAVVIERMREREDKDIIDVEATVYCERDTHKGIIIGKGGKMLKRISSLARADMEEMFGCRVNLQTWVKVKEDWRNRDTVLRNFGFDQKDFD